MSLIDQVTNPLQRVSSRSHASRRGLGWGPSSGWPLQLVLMLAAVWLLPTRANAEFESVNFYELSLTDFGNTQATEAVDFFGQHVRIAYFDEKCEPKDVGWDLTTRKGPRFKVYRGKAIQTLWITDVSAKEMKKLVARLQIKAPYARSTKSLEGVLSPRFHMGPNHSLLVSPFGVVRSFQSSSPLSQDWKHRLVPKLENPAWSLSKRASAVASSLERGRVDRAYEEALELDSDEGGWISSLFSQHIELRKNLARQALEAGDPLHARNLYQSLNEVFGTTEPGRAAKAAVTDLQRHGIHGPRLEAQLFNQEIRRDYLDGSCCQGPRLSGAKRGKAIKFLEKSAERYKDLSIGKDAAVLLRQLKDEVDKCDH